MTDTPPESNSEAAKPKEVSLPKLRTQLLVATSNNREDIANTLLERYSDKITQLDEYGQTILHFWAANPNPYSSAWIPRFLALGINVNARDNYGRTPLHVCSSSYPNAPLQNEDEMSALLADTLLGLGVDATAVDNNGNLCIHYAAQYGKQNLLRTLLSQPQVQPLVNSKQSDGATPLILASANGHVECVRLLCEHQAELEHTDNSGYTALFIACQQGSAELAEFLLSRGANPHALRQGITMAYAAAQGGYVRVLEILARFQSDVTRPSTGGFTPLHVACLQGHSSTVSYLLTAGADLQAVTDEARATPLHLAAKGGDIATVQLLLDAGAPIDALNSTLDSPLHVAAYWGHEPVVKELLQRGADHTLQDMSGATAYALAKAQNHERAYKRIKKFTQDSKR